MFSNPQRQQIATILGVANDLAIATLRPDGWPQVTTVSFVADGTRIYFGTWAKSQKAQNIERDPRVSVTVTAPYAEWSSIRGLSLSGRAVRITPTWHPRDVIGNRERFAEMVAHFRYVCASLEK